MDPQLTNPLTEAGGAPVNIHQALKTMMEPEPSAEPKPAPEARESARPEPRDSAPEADAAPAEEPVREQTESEEPAETPSLDPPRSWNKDAREKWLTLPRDVQEYLIERDQQQTSDLNRRQTEAEERRRAADAELTNLQSERSRYKQQLDAIVPALQQSIADEFADIKSPADLIALAQRDPARYTVWQAKQNALQIAHGQLQVQHEAQAKEAQAKAGELVQREMRALLDAKPELKDRAKQQAWVSELRDYAIEQGYTPEQFESNISHRNYLILEKARLFDKAQADAKKALVKPVPKVLEPGSAKDKTSKAAAERETLTKRAQQTGDLHDWSKLLRQ